MGKEFFLIYTLHWPECSDWLKCEILVNLAIQESVPTFNPSWQS